MEFAPGFSGAFKEESNFLKINVMGDWPLNRFWFFDQFHLCSLIRILNLKSEVAHSAYNLPEAGQIKCE